VQNALDRVANLPRFAVMYDGACANPYAGVDPYWRGYYDGYLRAMRDLLNAAALDAIGYDPMGGAFDDCEYRIEHTREGE